MAVRDAVALDAIDAGGGYIQQHIDNGVGQQIDLIDIEHAFVRLGDHARRESHFMARQSFGQVQAAGHMLDGGAQRQGDERRWRQQICQRTSRRGLGRAARALNQHAAQLGFDCSQQQGLHQRGLSLYG